MTTSFPQRHWGSGGEATATKSGQSPNLYVKTATPTKNANLEQLARRGLLCVNNGQSPSRKLSWRCAMKEVRQRGGGPGGKAPETKSMQIKRVQVLMEPAEFQQLELVAVSLGRSAGDLIREAIRDRWLVTDAQRLGAATALNGLDMPSLDIEHLDAVVTMARTEGLR